jgi:tRNA A-37 threonylcarbamoyl transferase component Bud32
MREFVRLQWLQKADVRAPRAAAVLMGLRLAGRVGDAVILDAIEPGVQLDDYLYGFALRGERAPNHLQLARQVRELIHTLGKAGLGHDDLHLGNFLLHGGEGGGAGGGRLYLLDAYAVRAGGLKMSDVMLLGHSVNRYATAADLQRGWTALGNDGPPPKRNPVSFKLWRKFRRQAMGENAYFGRFREGEWSGHFFKHSKFPRRWSPVSRLSVTEPQWRDAWRDLWARIDADQLHVIKRSASGDVLEGDIAPGGRPVSVIVKRPRPKYWHRYLTQIGRGARPRRAWRRSWDIIARDIPTAWPLLLMERRTFGYVTDTLIVYERVAGSLLTLLDLSAFDDHSRDTLFRRLGRTLRRLEDGGLAQFDAKSNNWMILDDASLGPVPVVIDVDGVRETGASTAPIERLLRSMKDHAQYTPADSLALCQGYAPHARTTREPTVDAEEDDRQTTDAERPTPKW